jgi:putative ABC transport system permease protein
MAEIMEQLMEIGRRLRMLLGQNKFDGELDDELWLHRELKEQELKDSGVAANDAPNRAMREVGNTLRLREESREAWGWSWLENCVQDLRFGLRMLRKSPGFAAVAIATLALGIGANTAIFSVAQSVLLRALRAPNVDRLMFVSRGYPGAPEGLGGGSFTYAAYHDMLAMNQSFDSLAAFQSFGALALTDGGEPVRVNVNYVTPNYMELLGAHTALGRIFRAEEDRYGDADAVIVLSHGFWQRQFAGAENTVGRTIHLNQQSFQVIGVASESFEDAPVEADSGEDVDAWIPLGLSNRLTGLSVPGVRTAPAILWGIGRLKPGVTEGQARAEFSAIGKKFAEMYPQTDRAHTVVAQPLKEQVVGAFYKPIWLLLAGSAFILLIGCANVANLLLARLGARHRELAVRNALGASPSRLVRQMLVENFLLVGIAAVAGLLLAVWGVAGLRVWGRLNLPSFLQFHVDGGVLGISILCSMLTGVVFGLGPALAGSRVDIRDALSQSGRQGGSLGRRGAARILVVAEVCLAMVLLVGAGLILKSFHQLTTIDLGFSTKNLLTLRLDLNSSTSDEAAVQFTDRLIKNLEVIPGVTSATLFGPNMPGHATWVIEGMAEGRDASDPKNIVGSNRHSVNPGALANLGIPLLRGRDFTPQDDAAKPLVAIISQGTAQNLWPGQDALGKRFQDVNHNVWLTVIGITADTRMAQRFVLSDAAMGYAPAGIGPQQDVFLPYAQHAVGALVIALRIQGDAAAITSAARSTVFSMDSSLPVYDVALLDERLANQDQASRAMTTLTSAYALLALFLAALGLFGVLANSVSRRTQELGIRAALGATRGDILRMVMREGLGLTLAGIAAGVAGALIMTRAMTSLLFGVQPGDPGVFAGIAALLIVVAALACYIPARRATRVDPLVALRNE